MNRKEEIRAQIAALQDELGQIKLAEFEQLNASRLGRHFKMYRDYGKNQWWWYLRVNKIDGEWLYGTTFQRTYDGRHEMEINAHLSGISENWTEIDASEYEMAWRGFLDNLIRETALSNPAKKGSQLLPEPDLQSAIIECIESIHRSAPPRQHYYDGLLNGLVWALTGTRHPTDKMTAAEIFTVTEIEHVVDGNDQVHYSALSQST